MNNLLNTLTNEFQNQVKTIADQIIDALNGGECARDLEVKIMNDKVRVSIKNRSVFSDYELVIVNLLSGSSLEDLKNI